MKKKTILIVDDEPDMLRLLERTLGPDLNCDVRTAESGVEALRILGRENFDLVLADIKMPAMDGLELLALIKRENPDQTVVMMTGHGSIESAVTAMKHGAYDFITKPFDHDALLVRLEKALERSGLLRENQRLKEACELEDAFKRFVGKSPPMKRVFDTIRMAAGTDLTVLITGESGTGKELAARAVHELSGRRKKSFVAVNCPTVPEQILESELFGYAKGAFTHATQKKTGLFQEAHNGTLFLDEIGDIGTAIQTKLLRAIQEKEIKPLGETRTHKVDVRIVASTNQDLKEKIRRGEFREDLFYRLNVIPVQLPPLRERREDIPLIAGYLLEKHCKKMNRPLKRLAGKLPGELMARPWEGNVRELENTILRGILYARGDEIQSGDLMDPEHLPASAPVAGIDVSGLDYRDAKEKVLRHFNQTYLENQLSLTSGNITQAARRCGLERQALQQIMKRYGVKPEPFRS